MIIEIKQGINFSQFLDNILAELSSKTLTRQEADDYSEKIIDEIEEEYNLFGAEGFPKLAEKHKKLLKQAGLENKTKELLD